MKNLFEKTPLIEILLLCLITIAMIIGIKSFKPENNTTFKVYYEYNIINNDTIPVDTIYIPYHHV